MEKNDTPHKEKIIAEIAAAWDLICRESGPRGGHRIGYVFNLMNEIKSKQKMLVIKA